MRGFTQDDAHIFCTKDHLYSEIEGVLDFIQYAMNVFGFKQFNAELSTRPEKFIGEKQDWDMAEKILEEVLKKKNFNYRINPGDGAFYGPKIDIKLKDALGREWQCATVQLDYNIPNRFDVNYRAASGEDLRVVMIHRVILGSLERFLATLIEHYAGKFPLWLAPTQVSILSVTPEANDYALEIKNKLEDEFRVDLDLRDERLPRKIREKELLKVPYIIVVGKNEKAEKNIAVRKRGMENLGNMDLNSFIDILRKE